MEYEFFVIDDKGIPICLDGCKADGVDVMLKKYREEYPNNIIFFGIHIHTRRPEDKR